MERQITLKDIAKEAGVAVSTVSRVVNRTQKNAASPQVQEKIWALVKKYNYVPNPVARSLKMASTTPAKRAKQTNKILCIMEDCASPLAQTFFNSIRLSLKETLAHTDYTFATLLVKNTETDDELQERFLQENSLGAIVLGNFTPDTLAAIQKQIPLLVCTGLTPVEDAYNQVISLLTTATTKALRYLHANGHKKIAYLGTVENASYKQVYAPNIKEKFGTDTLNEFSIECQADAASAYEALKEKIVCNSLPFSAIVCENLPIALGALKILNEHNISVPQDLSVLCLEENEQAAYFLPSLTTCKIPTQQLGKISIKILLDQIENGQDIPLKIELPVQMVERTSCQNISPSFPIH
ncbi:LacI family DNA-binding transcriptional regulator [Vagococcus entomophilus]|uniref:HTH lacI-type domain-containing protein n=1 Tax=Vagococcus entomophilus TaxID=1160095 RepID=A0A430AG01_9ENTE|nr:LacI family DNA-binding transcriptional regulator [Vagococcus entomophilus]RSU06842.1 hypothetical protein CBF30_06130 [Vagococcus entomophilus]